MRQQIQKAAVKRLRLSQIRTDRDTRTRIQIDEATAADYAERMIAGDRFPPVMVFFDGREYILADGFHRIRAARQARFETILAEVQRGTRCDALKFSLASIVKKKAKVARDPLVTAKRLAEFFESPEAQEKLRHQQLKDRARSRTMKRAEHEGDVALCYEI